MGRTIFVYQEPAHFVFVLIQLSNQSICPKGKPPQLLSLLLQLSLQRRKRLLLKKRLQKRMKKNPKEVEAGPQCQQRKKLPRQLRRCLVVVVEDQRLRSKSDRSSWRQLHSRGGQCVKCY